MSIIEGSKLVDLDKEKDPLRYNPIDPRKVTGKKEKHQDKHSGCHQQHSPVVSRTIQTEFHIQGTLRGRSPSRVPVKGGGKGQSFFISKSPEKVSEIRGEKNKSPKKKHSPSEDKSVDNFDDEMSEVKRKMLSSKTLVSDYKRYTDDYRAKFMILYRRIGLMFTKGRKRGTRVHQVRLLRSSYLYNFSHLGFVPHKFDNVDGELDPLPPQHRHMDHSYCLKVYI